MPVQISNKGFDAAVDAAIDQIPDEFLELIDNVVILVENDPPAGDPDILGFYDGVPITERDSYYGMVPPDSITLYRNPLKAMCDTTEQLIEEIAITVVHEIGHYFGIDDEHLDEMGWG